MNCALGRLTLVFVISLAFYGIAGACAVAHTELSNDAYCKFLNACAKRGDPHQLWNKLMADHFFGGIVRTGADGDWKYSAKPGYGRKPVTYISWESAARYCNWLSYGRPVTGASELGTTEGDETFGVYDTRQFGTPEFVRGNSTVRRNTDKAYFLPTAEEWRAAAFAGDDKGEPVVYDGHWARPFPHLADVDDGVTNQLGLVNMLGNVAEWVQDRRPNSSFFMALGGSIIRGRYSLAKNYIEGDESNKPIGTFGFRVAHADKPMVLPRPGEEDVVAYEESWRINVKAVMSSDWCLIGYPGNRRDPFYKVGRVDYEFEMARYPVTNEDWCRFLNVVGREKAIELGLYNPDMSTGVCGGIEMGDDGASFKCRVGCERRPVVYISYMDAMRYCNWLSSGDTEKGAYDVDSPNYHRLSGAKYFIPTDDEWCKAAYFDPTKLGGRKYWDYPCRTSDLPPNDPKLPHACNYFVGDHLGEKGPYYLSKVEDYPTSDTFFGCRQMAGNVWEWVEPVDEGCLNLRGTSYGYTEFGMGIWNRDCAGYSDELNAFGVRIARAVPNAKVAKPNWKRRIKDWLFDRLF